VPGHATAPAPTAAPQASAVVASPVGAITLVAAAGALTTLSMGPMPDNPAGAAALPADPDVTTRDGSPPADCDVAVLREAARQLRSYFAGELTTFDLPLAAAGTPFQHAVWAALREIPYGETTSYAAVAARIGRPSAARAVGLANGANPIGIVVPCHRVIGAGGALVGYAAGLDRKRFLLGLEERVSGRSLL
jgi:methylated-DNA-[protein]-cysteine S-methyltransferase